MSAANKEDDDDRTAADFRSYYLQQSTREFTGDLDQVRSADDFKAGDALPMLIQSLQQGTSMFSAADQRRIVDARKRRAEKEEEKKLKDDDDDDDKEEEGEGEGEGEEKEKDVKE
ncbi:ribosome-assembly protein 3-domain-containing protein [Biscogniauxia sp. FL1348]|nr:ribosome-assembly protein 3-domain-containing protein [Biscogniauxia sp. FL1348]